MKGQLAIIHSKELNNLITSLSDGKRAWLGGIRVGPGPKDINHWTWIDGTLFDYTNWSDYNFDNKNGHEFCMHINTEDNKRGEWNDINCNEFFTNDWFVDSYVCEVTMQ